MGSTTESLILVPLPSGTEDLWASVAFCRRICPGATLLVADFTRLHVPAYGGTPTLSVMTGRLAAIIAEAVRAHDLSLIPIIAVGRAEGADLAVCLGLAHGPLLAACILFHPTIEAMLVQPGALDGVHVLLVQNAAGEARPRHGPPLRDVLKTAGAEVICERASNHTGRRHADAALARVFIAALFEA